ncbi:MAG: hypothetical protein K2M78_08175 [Lachnospiraceae bacterium]|nr:hypothetical protein [Lachnospiraceae bacterium]
MQFLNRDFYNNTNLLNYINSSIQSLINIDASILNKTEYMLFFYIKEDFTANFFTLYRTDIDIECLGFSVLQRNTRHSIEAVLDLINLCHDSDYLSVMKYAANKGRYDPKYHSYIKGSLCSIPIKYKIATQMYKEDLPKSLLNISSKTNNYTHPNVFVDILNYNDYDKKIKILRNLLNMNLYTLTTAYKLILKKFNNDTIPSLGCTNCISPNPCYKNCNECFLNEEARFKNLIKNALITYTNPFQNTYYQ